MRTRIVASILSVVTLLLLTQSCITMTTAQPVSVDMSVGSDADATHMGSVTHDEMLARAAARSADFHPFDISEHSMPKAALKAYAEWFNRTVSTPQCKKAEAMVWIAAAGWGDSVNALTSSFRYALANGRLFFIQWQSANDKHMWRRGLRNPDFAWDWMEFIQSPSNNNCQFDTADIQTPRAFRKDHNPTPRVVSITGTIVADHPLAGSMDSHFNDHKHVMNRVSDAAIQDFLLKPNAELQEWIVATRKLLKAKRSKNFGGVIGIQVRTGYADNAEANLRPRNANFLANGDEKLFLNKFLEVFKSRYDSKPERTRVFLMTDSPDVRAYLTEEIETKRGVKIVSVEKGKVAHCGPSQVISQEGVLRMLAEWFVFKKHTDIQVITAWSLFGSSAVEGKPEMNIYRVDASNCGKPGAKPCQMG